MANNKRLTIKTYRKLKKKTEISVKRQLHNNITNCHMLERLMDEQDDRNTSVMMMSHLAGRRIGHAPHGGDHRQGTSGLVGGLLPAGWVVGVRAVTADTRV